MIKKITLLKWVIILGFCAALLGCGHGFEGEYSTKSGSSNEILNAFAGAVGTNNVIIGSDYTESGGKRQNFSDIFVRESGSEKYLIFKLNDTEESWKIIDENTLIAGNELASLTLKRIDK